MKAKQMAISYQPGEEIQLQLPGHPKQFFAKALKWSDQKALVAVVNGWSDLDNDGQIDKALEILKTRITRIEPDYPLDQIDEILDEKHIWDLFVALRRNLTQEEKKS
jgi:hypothetical protein